MNHWPSIVETHPDNHMLHTFLSCNLSFSSLSPVTSLIMPTNDGPVLLLASQNNFKTMPDVGCSKINSPQSTLLCTHSLFQCCNRDRQLSGYLSFNSLTPEPSCSLIQHTIDKIGLASL